MRGGRQGDRGDPVEEHGGSVRAEEDDSGQRAALRSIRWIVPTAVLIAAGVAAAFLLRPAGRPGLRPADPTLAAPPAFVPAPWRPVNAPRNGAGFPEFMHERTGLRFVLLPGGTFRMGSPPDEAGRFEREEPLHEVTVPPFLLCTTECTQQAWEKGGGVNGSKWRGPDLPVEEVSWVEVRDWCPGNGLRLPSEAEWEYACRAGTEWPWSCGTDENQLWEYAVFNTSSDLRSEPAGKRLPNRFGLFDMHGNVWEWCQDRWHDDYAGAPRDGSAWEDGVSEYRVTRGGSWYSLADQVRSASRSPALPLHKGGSLGFRPAAPVP